MTADEFREVIAAEYAAYSAAFFFGKPRSEIEWLVCTRSGPGGQEILWSAGVGVFTLSAPNDFSDEGLLS